VYRDDIARSITMILQNPDLARKLGEQAHRRIVQEFTWDRFAGHLRQLLTSATRAHRGFAPLS
jgi:glycosyltransferase involved in cell wall biosynthesis